MYEYVTPSKSVFQNRKLFHSHQKEQYETVDQWFRCIVNSLESCKYGKLSEFMLIDKFITGLDDETYCKFASWATLTMDTVQSIALDFKNPLILKNPLKSPPCQEIGHDVSHFLDVGDIKVEEDDAVSLFQSEEHNREIPSPEQHRGTPSGDPTEVSNEEFSLGNCDNVKSVTLVRENSADGCGLEIKGFKREKNSGIICLDCGKCFKQKNTYNYHKRRHTGNNLSYCNVCGKVFVNSIQMKRHSLTHDNDNKSFECHLCSSKFDRIHGLRIHFTILHTRSTKCNLQCFKCNKAFSKQRDFDLHIKIHQGLINGHKCEHCHKNYDKLSALKEHLVVHMKTKEFVCETCGRAFKTKHLLKRHIQGHNDERQFKCCECGQNLKSSQTLKNHMRQHTGERPYRCHLCLKTFVTQPSLLKHLRVHRQEKPHGCTVCTKRFATNYHLKVHMNTHTGAKPYECNQCDRAFTQLGTLKTHQAKIHSFVEYSI